MGACVMHQGVLALLAAGGALPGVARRCVRATGPPHPPGPSPSRGWGGVHGHRVSVSARHGATAAVTGVLRCTIIIWRAGWAGSRTRSRKCRAPPRRTPAPRPRGPAAGRALRGVVWLPPSSALKSRVLLPWSQHLSFLHRAELRKCFAA